jgi:hypothetical protein
MSVVCAAALLAACAAVFSGCTIGRLIGGMAESSRRQGMHEEKAKYTGLTDKTFAVIVAADRSIQADFPSVISVVTLEITKRLADNSGAKGVLPATEVLKYQSQHPGWVAKPLNTLAKELAVERVVYVDLQDFTLTDPGNPYIYNGVASGTIHVIDPESATPGEFAFGEAVRVKYPDMSGMGPTQIPRNQVLSELARRFIERSAWALYTHEEPNVIKY